MASTFHRLRCVSYSADLRMAEEHRRKEFLKTCASELLTIANAAEEKSEALRYRCDSTGTSSGAISPVSSQRSSDVGINPAASNSSMNCRMVKRSPS